MSVFTPIPLGQRIPATSPHAVSASLPTMRAVRGYEEKDPEITRHMPSGYPRFVVHPFLQQLAEAIVQRQALAGHTVWLASSAAMARRLVAYLGTADAQPIVDDGIHGVAHPSNPDLATRAKTFLQHTGGFLSSRAAEDRLVQLGLLSAAVPETLFVGDASAEIRRHLAPVFPSAAPADILLSNCGMSAIDAAFRAASETQAARGRTIWIQLGWLYLDTIALLKKFSATPADYLHVRNVFDRAGLERIFRENGDRIAGIIAEVPTNPLIQTPDIPALASLAHRHGALVILDPTVSCAWNLDVLPHADIVVTSLTKYAGSEGDLTAGLAVVNPAGADAVSLQRRVSETIEPLYTRDAARLAIEIAETTAVLAQNHASMVRVVDFLSHHPAVKEVFWPLHPASRDNYLRLARSPDALGGMLTFTLHGSMETFYDRLCLPKGPSFGMKTSLACPFMYLAHYDLVTTPAGRAELAANGLDPDLIRLALGTERPEEIIAALAEALSAIT